MSNNAYYAVRIERKFLFDTNIFSQTKHQKKQKKEEEGFILNQTYSLKPFILEFGVEMGHGPSSNKSKWAYVYVKLHISP